MKSLNIKLILQWLVMFQPNAVLTGSRWIGQKSLKVDELQVSSYSVVKTEKE